LCWMDVSTGVMEHSLLPSLSSLARELARLSPAEILIPQSLVTPGTTEDVNVEDVTGGGDSGETMVSCCTDCDYDTLCRQVAIDTPWVTSSSQPIELPGERLQQAYRMTAERACVMPPPDCRARLSSKPVLVRIRQRTFRLLEDAGDI
jgi:hypothetical protein